MLAAWLPTFNSSSNSWDPVLGTVPGYRYKRRLGYATEADETVEEAISASYELSEIFTLLARSILGQTSYASVPVSQTPLST